MDEMEDKYRQLLDQAVSKGEDALFEKMKIMFNTQLMPMIISALSTTKGEIIEFVSKIVADLSERQYKTDEKVDGLDKKMTEEFRNVKVEIRGLDKRLKGVENIAGISGDTQSGVSVEEEKESAQHIVVIQVPLWLKLVAVGCVVLLVLVLGVTLYGRFHS